MEENRQLYGIKPKAEEPHEPKPHPFTATARHERWCVDIRYIEKHRIPEIKGSFYVITVMDALSHRGTRAARPTLHDAHVSSHFAALPVVVAVPSGCVGIEELHQYRSKSRRSDLVRLAFQRAMLAVGESLRQRHCCGMHERE
jgi:hypothetical protein